MPISREILELANQWVAWDTNPESRALIERQ